LLQKGVWESKFDKKEKKKKRKKEKRKKKSKKGSVRAGFPPEIKSHQIAPNHTKCGSRLD